MPNKLPLVRQIDHVAIRTEHPRRLFSVFTRILGLPAAFPLAEYPTLTSGGIALGNIFLEVVRFGPPHPADVPFEMEADEARPFILSFAPNGRTLKGLDHALDARHIPHSGALPFYGQIEPEPSPAAKIWANIFLGGLLGETPLARTLFFASHFAHDAPPRRAPDKRSGERMRRVIDRCFPAGMVFFTEYYRGDDGDGAKRAADRDGHREADGGALGVERVCEVRVGVPGIEEAWRRWSRLFAPIEPAVPCCWPLGDGPALRLIPAAHAGIQTLVLQVRSLDRARRFLRARDLLGDERDGELTLDLPKTRGLDIRLVA